MKKLLSTILCCVMLFGLMIPMTVSAAVPAFDGSTALRIQFEDYVSSASVPLSNGSSQASSTTSTAAGDGLLMIDTRGVDEASKAGYSFDIQFTAPAGNYEFSYAHGTTFSGATFAVNGAALSAGAKGADLAYPWGSAGKTYGGTVSIATAGTQTLTVTVDYNTTRAGYLILLDYFEIAPVAYPDVTVTNAGETKIELADYAPYIAVPSSSGTQGASASADANGNQFIALNISGASVSSYTLEVPFTVAEGSAGEYNYSYVISDGLDPISFAIDTTTLSASANGTTYSGWNWGNSGVVYDSNARINLTAGDHVLKVTVSRNSGGRIAKLIGAFTFKPYVETTFTVTNAENAKLEVADYAYMVAVPISGGTEGASASADASGNKILALNAANATVSSYTLEIPFDVAAGSAGYYTFEYIIADGLDPISFAIDTTAVSGATTGVTYSGWNWGNNGVVYATSALTNLTAGRHTLNITFYRNSSNRIAKLVGAFTFKPYVLSTPDAVAVNEDKVTIEVEDYKDSVIFVNAANAAYTPTVGAGASLSGGKALQLDYSPLNAGVTEIVIPVTLAKSGLYNFEYGHTSSFSNVPVTVTIGSQNLTSGATVNASESNIVYPTGAGGFSYAGGYGKYTKNDVYLTAGDYNITFSVSPRADGLTVKYLDYISLDWTTDPFAAPELGENPTYAFSGESALRVQMEDLANTIAILGTNGWVKASTLSATAEQGYAGTVLVFDTGIGGVDLEYYDVPVKVNVAKAGIYNITARYGTGLSGVNLLVNNTDVSPYLVETDGYAPTDVGIFRDAGISEVKVTGVSLTEGENTITFRVTNRGDGQIAKTFDYVEIAPIAVENCEDELTIEFENYTHLMSYNGTRPYIYSNGVASEGAFVHYRTVAAGGIESINVEIPFTVEAAGWYDVEYMGTTSWVQTDGKGKVIYSVGGKNITETATADTDVDRNWLTGTTASGVDAYSGVPVKYTNVVYLEKGANTLTATVSARGTDVVTSLDYVKLVKRAVPAHTGEALTIEVENYADTVFAPWTTSGSSGYDGAENRASGAASGSAIFVMDTNGYVTGDYYDVVIPFTVATDGVYKFDIVTTDSASTWDVVIDGEVANKAKNTAHVDKGEINVWYEGMTSTGYYASGALTAGAHTLALRINKRTGDGDFAKAFDCVTVTRTGDIQTSSITFANGKVSATYELEEAVDGVALLVIYNGKEFAGIAYGTVDGTTVTAELSVEEDVVFTEAKLFVWKDYDTSYAPLVAPLVQSFLAEME